jgi:hypothetical protein
MTVDSLTNRIDSTITDKDVVDPLRDSILLDHTRKIISAFKNVNYDSISMFIHPEDGVRFSPYSVISIKKDVLVKAEDVKGWKDKKKQAKLEWGSFDGNDKPINLTPDEYVKRFVYDVNFLKADSIKINEFIGSGNTLNNLTEVYPGSSFVEYYYPGDNKKNAAHNWRSLRLVYKFKSGKYFLVGVVHDEWTI